MTQGPDRSSLHPRLPPTSASLWVGCHSQSTARMRGEVSRVSTMPKPAGVLRRYARGSLSSGVFPSVWHP